MIWRLVGRREEGEEMGEEVAREERRAERARVVNPTILWVVPSRWDFLKKLVWSSLVWSHHNKVCCAANVV